MFQQVTWVEILDSQLKEKQLLQEILCVPDWLVMILDSGFNISHLGKRNVIFKSALGILRGYVSSLEGSLMAHYKHLPKMNFGWCMFAHINQKIGLHRQKRGNIAWTLQGHSVLVCWETLFILVPAWRSQSRTCKTHGLHWDTWRLGWMCDVWSHFAALVFSICFIVV